MWCVAFGVAYDVWHLTRHTMYGILRGIWSVSFCLTLGVACGSWRFVQHVVCDLLVGM